MTESAKLISRTKLENLTGKFITSLVMGAIGLLVLVFIFRALTLLSLIP